jgi:UMP-CMP kinase
MTKRILLRATQTNRTDDNIKSLKKRFKVFEEETLPVIKHYEKMNKVLKVIEQIKN